MSLKIVYGPPATNEERIEPFSLEQDGEIREMDSLESVQSDICRSIKALHRGKLRYPANEN